MSNTKPIKMTQSEARAKYPWVVMADGDYIRKLCTEQNANQTLSDWQSENPDAYIINSDCVIGESYDATKQRDLMDADTERPIIITQCD
jgi:hypothetical protein